MIHNVNSRNLSRLIEAVQASTTFNMERHETCMIGLACGLDTGKSYQRYHDYNSRDLGEFVGVDDPYEAFNLCIPINGKPLGDITVGEAVDTLHHLLICGKVAWPWQRT